jgi:preprotein translocase subunit YajC
MEFEVGDQVITIGGIIGTLTAIDLEENVAQLRIAEGVEVELVPGALGRKLVPETEEGREGAEQADVDA